MNMTLLDTPSIIGIIVVIALVATTIAVCLYLYAQKNKPSEELDSAEEENEGKQDTVE